MASPGSTRINYVIYSLIAPVAFLGNALVIYVLVFRRRAYLRRPYNIFLLSLAVIDCITSVFIVFSRFLYLPHAPTYSVIAGEVFCRTLWLAWILFSLGYASIYTCLALTIERWLAVVKPHTYRLVRPKHAIMAVIFVWVWGFAVNSTSLFRVKYSVAKQRCTWTTPPYANDVIPWLDITFQSLIPFTSMVILYGHIYRTLKKFPNTSDSGRNQLRKITVVALATSSALIVGWLPGRITFMLTKFGVLDANGVIHVNCALLAFLNSCANPFLYGIYSSQFRGEYITIFNRMTSCVRRPDVSPMTEGSGPEVSSVF